MKTEDFVTMLATGVEAVDPRAAVRRYAGAVGAGVLGGRGPHGRAARGQRQSARDASVPMGWAKFAFVAGLFVVRCARRCAWAGRARRWPGCRRRSPHRCWGCGSSPPSRSSARTGRDGWSSCSARRPPPVPSSSRCSPPQSSSAGSGRMQGLAPTRLRLAGASVGLLAGAAGACVYAFHCPELAAPFLGTWYVLGMAIPTALGALLGPRVLRW